MLGETLLTHQAELCYLQIVRECVPDSLRDLLCPHHVFIIPAVDGLIDLAEGVVVRKARSHGEISRIYDPS